MTRYVVLLRGINVGGKNPLSMAALKQVLEELGAQNVATYINSGNVVLDSAKSAKALAAEVEQVLPQKFKLHDEVVKVLALSAASFKKIIAERPKGFGDAPTTYHSDAIFLMGDAKVAQALDVFTPKDGVDAIWPGKGLVYSQRLSAERTKSRLNRIMGTPIYKSMTIRSWQTVQKLAELF